MDNLTFEKLVLCCEDTLYRVSMSILKNEQDAEDAVSEAILRAYENLRKLKHEEYFRTWLIRILINCCKRQLRLRSHYTDIGDHLPDIPASDNPYSRIETGEAINRLPPKIRIAVILYYSEDYSVKEISEILHIPEGTVKSRLNKGRTLLKDELIL